MFEQEALVRKIIRVAEIKDKLREKRRLVLKCYEKSQKLYRTSSNGISGWGNRTRSGQNWDGLIEWKRIWRKYLHIWGAHKTEYGEVRWHCLTLRSNQEVMWANNIGYKQTLQWWGANVKKKIHDQQPTQTYCAK